MPRIGILVGEWYAKDWCVSQSESGSLLYAKDWCVSLVKDWCVSRVKDWCVSRVKDWCVSPRVGHCCSSVLCSVLNPH